MPTKPLNYTPPLRAIGTVRFRPGGPSHLAYEADTPRGRRLVYWSPVAQCHIPVFSAAAVLEARIA